MAHPQIEMETVGQLTSVTGLQEIGIEIDDVQCEWRVAGRIGFAAPVFDEDLALTSAEAALDTVQLSLEGSADCGEWAKSIPIYWAVSFGAGSGLSAYRR